MKRDHTYTIGELARALGVPTTTLRYYERVGILAPEDRSSGNYRLYTEATLRRLRFIRAAQAIGFTLDQIKTLLRGDDSRGPPCRVVQRLLEERLADVERRLKDLRHVQRVLKAALQKCRDSDADGCCHVVESLHAKSS